MHISMSDYILIFKFCVFAYLNSIFEAVKTLAYSFKIGIEIGISDFPRKTCFSKSLLQFDMTVT